MSFEIIEAPAGNVVEVHVTGTLTRKAYDAFVPLTEKKIKEFGEVRILFMMHGFLGWSVRAAWEDLKFDLKHFDDIERLALVGETQWQKGMAVFCRPLLTAKIKYFDRTELDKARAWVAQ